jgi:hypothetical protein
MLSAKELRTDPILVRKIRRMQQAEADEAEQSSGDEDSDSGSVTVEKSVQLPGSQQTRFMKREGGTAGGDDEEEEEEEE